MKKILAVMMMVIMPFSAFAQEKADDVLTACRPDDMVGVWDMIKLSANYNYDKTNAWFYPNQMMVFERDGTFLHYTSAASDTPEHKKEILAQLPKTQTYKLESGGQLRTDNKTTGDNMQYACLIFTKDKGVNKKGDLLLAAGKESGAIAVKAMRKSSIQE